MISVSIKLMINKYFVCDNNINLDTKINIPKPRIVETWLGPKPPEVKAFESVPVIISRRLGVNNIK